MYRLVVMIGILSAAAGVAGHFLIFGPKHPELRREKPLVRRFNLWERLVHAVTLLSFLALATTGLTAAWRGKPLEGWWLLVHWTAAPFFAVGLAALTLTWSEFGHFERHDLLWARHLGGYLGGPDDLPAGMFNAGQKAFLWVVALLGVVTILSGLIRMAPIFDASGQATALTVHRYAALFLALSIVVHFYLGTLANPGTIRAMLLGRVGRAWVRRHHPVWAERLGLDSADEPPTGETDSGESRKNGEENTARAK